MCTSLPTNWFRKLLRLMFQSKIKIYVQIVNVHKHHIYSIFTLVIFVKTFWNRFMCMWTFITTMLVAIICFICQLSVCCYGGIANCRHHCHLLIWLIVRSISARCHRSCWRRQRVNWMRSRNGESVMSKHWEIWSCCTKVCIAWNIILASEMTTDHSILSLLCELSTPSHFTLLLFCALKTIHAHGLDSDALWAVGHSTCYPGLTTPVCKPCLVEVSESRQTEPAPVTY